MPRKAPERQPRLEGVKHRPGGQNRHSEPLSERKVWRIAPCPHCASYTFRVSESDSRKTIKLVCPVCLRTCEWT